LPQTACNTLGVRDFMRTPSPAANITPAHWSIADLLRGFPFCNLDLIMD
jgi:hypothetical protein